MEEKRINTEEKRQDNAAESDHSAKICKQPDSVEARKKRKKATAALVRHGSRCAKNNGKK